MSDNKPRVITKDIIHNSILNILGMTYFIIVSILLYQTTKFTMRYYAMQIILVIVGVNECINFIIVFSDIKDRIKLKKNSGL